MRRPVALVLGAVLLTACASGEGPPVTSVDTVTDAPRPAPVTTVAAPSEPAGAPTVVHLRVTSHADGIGQEEFAALASSILTDARGWEQAGFRFRFDAPADAPYELVLAEGDEVDQRCLPYDTSGTYSCQNGATVALNADRWRQATPGWTGSLADYRVMLVNHEIGHLLHLHHPQPQCPGEGLPAPVMMQQSTELGACTANPWPLPWEIDLASQQREPLAPPADHDVSDHRPAPPNQRHDG